MLHFHKTDDFLFIVKVASPPSKSLLSLHLVSSLLFISMTSFCVFLVCILSITLAFIFLVMHLAVMLLLLRVTRPCTSFITILLCLLNHAAHHLQCLALRPIDAPCFHLPRAEIGFAPLQFLQLFVGVLALMTHFRGFLHPLGPH